MHSTRYFLLRFHDPIEKATIDSTYEHEEKVTGHTNKPKGKYLKKNDDAHYSPP